MAKKKKRKRRIQEAPAAAPTPRARQERKEAARRERERIIRAARRRRLMTRAIRWGVVVAVLGGATAFVGYRFYEDRRLLERAAAAADTLGCGEIQSLPSEGRGHLQQGSSPPEYGTTPATSGPHSSSTLPSDVHAYDQAVPEPLAVHNLEHAYVIIYYRAEGNDALPENVRAALAELAQGQEKVIMAPYPDLSEGTSLAFTAWTKLQECPRVTDADKAVLAVQGFIKQFRGTSNAPEPSSA
ncbi:MAG TPA: DUF3105 domain-containing protein [Actinomycetota bacterium]|jgi:hypothetical protein|nr:DUF3105 domain-containing protein [Actinomycetota bacterium]